ncbi:MAG: LPS-assembly protein LptD [Candidatus Electrothrix sp. MAN1_4]|nr:LPS-assembly protein LptD [Candidatus Electrothrix sp. MAN1_4]
MFEVHYRTLFSPFITVACFLGVFLLLKPTDIRAEAIRAMQWEITAKKLTRYEDPASVIAEGDVVLQKMENIPRITSKKKEEKGWADLLGQDAPTSSNGNDNDNDNDNGVSDKALLMEGGEATLITPKKAPALDALGEADTKNAATEEEVVVTSAVITTIKADWVAYDMDLGTVKLRGNVLIDIGPDTLRASEGTVHLTRETASFTDAVIIRQYKDMHVEGRVIEKTGELTYHIKDGWLVTCKMKGDEAPPWSFNAADAEITDGGYAYLKHATFRIKDVPVLYSPVR